MPKKLKHPTNIIPLLSFHRHFCHIKKVLRNQEGRRKKGTKKGEREKLRGVGERKNGHNKKYRSNSGCWTMSWSVLNLFVKADASFTLKKNTHNFMMSILISHTTFFFSQYFLDFFFILYTNSRSLFLPFSHPILPLHHSYPPHRKDQVSPGKSTNPGISN